jgi:hypothetical protein
MSRKLLLINELKRVYVDCNNVEKDKLVKDCLDSIKSLTITPEVKNES